MNTPHSPQEAIRTPYPTRKARLQQARALLEAAVGRYMQREGDDVSMRGPRSIRERVESTIFEICESLSGYADVREVLYLALEDPSLALSVPSMFDPGAAPDYDDDVYAAFLLSEAFWDFLGKQLWAGWRARPVCCEICGVEPCEWRWVPAPLERPDDTWAIGPACKAVLDQGGMLTYKWHSVWGCSNSPLVFPPPAVSGNEVGTEETCASVEAVGSAAAIGSLPPGFQTLAQREADAREALTTWFAQCLRSTRGTLPRAQTSKARIRRLATASLPQENEPIPLLLLALEAPSLAEEPPPDVVAILRKQDGEVTAAQLLRSNLSLHLIRILGEVVQEQLTSYWSARPDGCELCQRECREWIWYPLASRAPRFALPEQERQNAPALRIGFACKAIIESGGGALHFLHQDRLYHASKAEGVILCPGLPACLVQPLLASRKDGQV